MKNVVLAVALCILVATGLFGQMTSLTGTVTDPSGAVVPNAVITVVNTETGLQRQDKSDAQGRYGMEQLSPGTYRLTAKASGFADIVINRFELLVNQPATMPITFEKIGATSTTISVEANATQVNTQDASLGNAVGTQAIVELPFFARNVANLLQYQPGVTSFGTNNDDRNGSVNGGRSDQGNVTLDGADVNNEHSRAAFTSVLRVTLDSVEEFRSTTTNADATKGRGSGADVALVTKSGTNQYHGSLYEYRRGTETAANGFFSNRASVPRAALLINIFGGSAGGPIKKNKAFFFLNYEGRRDASATVVSRTVPAEATKQGIVLYHDAKGVLQQVSPEQAKAIDPLGIGINQAALKIMQGYPAGNNNSVGDGLNTLGYTFNSPQHSDQNTYIARLDYHLDEAGKHSLFWRGNLQNDSQNGTPQFPGMIPNSVTLANNKGFATGWTAVLTPTMVSTLRYGLTRVGGETTGILNSGFTAFRGYSTPFGTSTGTARIVPVHTLSEDLSWSHGAHDLRFGGMLRLISDRSISFDHSFSSATTNSSGISGSGADITPASLGINKNDTTSYQYTMSALLGIIAQATGNYNYLTDGTVLPVGAPVTRNWVDHASELYAQDSWKLKSNFTMTYGVRLSLMPPVHEANGQQVSTDIPIGTWFNQRGALMDQGKSASSMPPITYVLANSAQGRPLYPYHTAVAPRLAFAWSPNASSGLARFLFGGPGKTSIRAGAGMYYDEIGEPLADSFDSTAFGLSTSLNNPLNVLDSTQLPRFTSFFTLPAQLIPPAPKGGFPVSYPDAFAITNSIDDHLKAPYTMNLNFSIGRQFSHGLFVQASYVGRLSRHSLIQRDLAMPGNLKDPKSGQTYFQAMTQLATAIDFKNLATVNSSGLADVSKITPIPFFENMWATAAGKGFSATQVIAKEYLERNNQGDFTSVLADMDNGDNCGAAGSVFRADGRIRQTGCGVLGAYSMFSPQFAALSAWSSLGSGAYHSAQVTVRKQTSNGLLFDLNYTFSKSIDIGSHAESSDAFTSDFMINSWDPSQLRAVSGYDVRHSVNAYMVWQLPFGRNKKFARSINRALDALVGGWEISGTYRQTSGLPFSVSDGSRWATNWQLSSFATPNGTPIPQTVSAHNAPGLNGVGGPNLWTDPASALAGFSETMAGQTGSRNSLRGEGFFNIDTGLYKNFTLAEGKRLQIRWESFNVSNTVRFDPASANLSLTSSGNFGKLTGQLGSPRQMQFAMRLSF
ncbi:MAG: carboxypeptidase regulatory-like domain-containing protein [Acidobacteriia bacterium]|nr:carboxypeptidase regulatory-like domain-containing protein [Terriglobia bacterium]